jgi:hypothetical protein
MNRPNFQLEEDYAFYYPQDPYFYVYDEHSDLNADYTDEQQQSDQIHTNTAEATTSEPSAVSSSETDDLNFQAVVRSPPAT